MKITDLELGDVYELKDSSSPDMLIQIGLGGDCGVFVGATDKDQLGDHPDFRIIMNQKDLRKNWRNIGQAKLAADLSHLAEYGDQDIGMDAKYKVRIDNIDNRTAVSETEYHSLERLAVWETVHILDRVKQV